MENKDKLPQLQSRWFSMFSTPKTNDPNRAMHLNIQNGILVSNRHESTAAAADTSDPPSEKFEYQAEVSSPFLELRLLLQLL